MSDWLLLPINLHQLKPRLLTPVQEPLTGTYFASLPIQLLRRKIRNTYNKNIDLGFIRLYFFNNGKMCYLELPRNNRQTTYKNSIYSDNFKNTQQKQKYYRILNNKL